MFDETRLAVYSGGGALRLWRRDADGMQTPLNPNRIARLLDERRVLLVVGAGGAGKTTLSAALGVAAAQRGRRTLVLTVDPAKRLANALGLQAFSEHVQHISAADFAAQGCDVPLGLDAAMLDVKRTFDRVVSRYARSPESARRILEHPFYQQASTALAGSQEYMATERLYESVNSGDYDLVVLDTPPAEHALDFIDAPRRLIDLFDSPTFRKLITPSSRLRSGVFRPSSVVMKGLQRFTTVEMFSNLLEFFGQLSETFDGFVSRARDVQALLQGPDAAFVLVSGCDAVSAQQARSLQEHVVGLGMNAPAWIVNRVFDFAPSLAEPHRDLAGDLLAVWHDNSAAPVPADLPALMRNLAQVSEKLGKLADRDRELLREVTAGVAPQVHVTGVPRRVREPDNLRELFEISNILLCAAPLVEAEP
ncbi:MAG: ArsA family ATPase [Deltaproteobacteria bacterium]|nr:ArsA family ATPase [Deltaproteobacteria bacterium]